MERSQRLLISDQRFPELAGEAIDRVLRAIAGCFQTRSASMLRARWEIPLLAAIVVLGIAVRFWGLGDVGLHGEDEDTTALAAVHILVDGTPRFPSGMFYSRAIVQSYLIAGSVLAFGQTEWAIRLPSVLCGALLIILAYFVGRRFLDSVWNLAFVAAVAFTPELILVSQNARMYIFLLASLAGFTALIFRWERTEKVNDLWAAVIVMALALQFQLLAVFAILLFFFPPLLHADKRKLYAAITASVACAVTYVVMAKWNSLFYFKRAVDFGIPDAPGPAAAGMAFNFSSTGAGIAILVALGCAIFASSSVRRPLLRWILAALIFLSLTAQITRNYHLAVLFFSLAAIITWRDSHSLSARWLAPLVAAFVIFVMQWWELTASGISSPRNVIGVLVGTPSVWAYINFAKLSVGAALIAGLGAVLALIRVANGKIVADHWIFFVLGVWIPLLVVGVFQWYPAPRYTIGCLLPLLVTVFAVGQAAVGTISERIGIFSTRNDGFVKQGLAGAVLLLSVNPQAVSKAVDSGYETHPDHKGAAEFVKSLPLRSRDIVIAEDVLMQTYYLGRVDYWLMARTVAAPFVYKPGKYFFDQYTNTRIISSGDELRKLLNDPDRGAVYIIGSGEVTEAERSYFEGEGILEALMDPALKKIYVGRDHKTTVLFAAARQGK